MSRVTIFATCAEDKKSDEKGKSVDENKENVSPPLMHGKGYYKDKTSRRALKDFVLRADIPKTLNGEDESQIKESSFMLITNS